MSDLLSMLPLPLQLVGWAAVIVGGPMLGLALLGALFQVAGVAGKSALALTERLSDAIARAILGTARGAGIGIGALFLIGTGPLARLRDGVHDALILAVDKARERRRQERELRDLWNSTYRDEFKTFAAFKAAFENGGKQEGNGAQPGADPFAEACRTLGLPADGAFTRDEMKARFHELLKAVHPDKGGTDVLANLVTAARETICARKGWKK